MKGQEERSLRERLKAALECADTAPQNTIVPLVFGAQTKARKSGKLPIFYLEKRVPKKVFISELKDSSSKSVSSPSDILNLVEIFYSNLLSSESSPEHPIALALQPITAQRGGERTV